MSKVRNEAASVIAMQAHSTREHAAVFDNIGERGTGDRMKRVAGELDLAAELLRNYGKNQKTEVPELEVPEVEPTPVFKVGQKVRTKSTAPLDPNREFTVAEVVPMSGTIHGDFYVTPVEDMDFGGVWETHVEAVEPLAQWERELLNPIIVGKTVKIVNDGTIGYGHPIGTVGEVVGVYIHPTDETRDSVLVKAEFRYADGDKQVISLNHSISAVEEVVEEPHVYQTAPFGTEPEVGSKVKLNAEGKRVFGAYNLPEILTLKAFTGTYWTTEEPLHGEGSDIAAHLRRSEFEVVV